MIQQTLKLIPITIIQMENCIRLIPLWDRAEMIPYKYIRYKAGGKTYTVYAYCMQHSKQSRQVERLIKIWSNWMKVAMTVI